MNCASARSDRKCVCACVCVHAVTEGACVCVCMSKLTVYLGAQNSLETS